MYNTVMRRPEVTHRSARRGFSRPRCCPTRIVMAIPRPIMGMNARVLMLNAMLVAARADVPRRPTIKRKMVKPARSTKNWTPLGRPKRMIRRTQGRIESPAPNDMETAILVLAEHEPAIHQEGGDHRDVGGDGGAGDPHLRKAADAEDQQIIEDDVDGGGDQVGPHDRPRLAAAGEEAAQRRGGDGRKRSQAEDAEVDDFPALDLGIVSDEAEGRVGERDEACHDDGPDQRHVETLPDGRTDPLVSSRPDVLRDEGAHVARGPDEQAHQGVVQDAGRRRGGKGRGGVPGEKHAIHEMLERPRAGTQDQRERDEQDLPVATLGHPGTVLGCPQTLRQWSTPRPGGSFRDHPAPHGGRGPLARVNHCTMRSRVARSLPPRRPHTRLRRGTDGLY